jgi:hypothetical protein
MRKADHTGKKTQAKRTRSSASAVVRRPTTSSRQKSKAAIAHPDGVITLNAADSRKLEQMLSRPAREPSEYVKAALADYRRLIQD